MIVIDELHVQSIQDCDQVGSTDDRDVHSATEGNESQEILADRKSDTCSTVES